jgi:hypothetical protein
MVLKTTTWEAFSIRANSLVWAAKNENAGEKIVLICLLAR